MHTRRVSTFLLGAWMGCSVFMAFVILENLHSASLVMTSPVAAVAKMIKTLGPDQMELLLRHQAAEQSRNLLYIWQEAQIVLALALGGCLYFATQKRILSVVLCGIMLVLVLFQITALTPEVSYRGRAMDFPVASASTNGMMGNGMMGNGMMGNGMMGNGMMGNGMMRVLLLYQMLVVSEGLKLIVGGILASYLFVFRTSRKRTERREPEADALPNRAREGADRR